MEESFNTTQHNNATTTLKVITYKVSSFQIGNRVQPEEYADFAINAYDYDIVRNLLVTYGQVSEEDVEETFRKRLSSRSWTEPRNVVGFQLSVSGRAHEELEMRLDDKHRVVGITLKWVVNIDPILKQLKLLPNVTKLVLKNAKCEPLPSCIGDFYNLKVLRIDHSFGNLSKLERLPKEIGNLRNLEELILKDTHLKALPEEIGKLTNLTLLDLSDTTTITSLPSSMPPNLEELILVNAYGLKELPSNIGNLTNLIALVLLCSGIQSLPDSCKSLKKLQYLWLGKVDYSEDDYSEDDYPEAENPEFSLEALVHRYPSLVFLLKGLERDALDAGITIALACNRARISIGLGLQASHSRMSHPVVPKAALWPYMLQHPVRPFNRFPPSKSRCLQDYKDVDEIQEHDAIYQLLSNHQIVPRARIGLGWAGVPKLWPYVLQRSTIPFNHYHPLEPHPKCYKRRFDVQEQDAVYLLLSIHRDSFLGVLNHRGDSSKRKYPSV